jgi:hypothetical protein
MVLYPLTVDYGFYRVLRNVSAGRLLNRCLLAYSSGKKAYCVIRNKPFKVS